MGGEYETLLGAFDKENEVFKKRVGKDRVRATYMARVRARNHVAAFIRSHYKRNDISMPELTPDFIKEFAVFLSNEAGLHNGSIWENCMWLKGVVMRAHFFVFASFTALSFVDIKELSNDQIVEVNGEKWIISKRHKTGVPFQVKLLDIPLQIIERYKAFQENNLVFPNLNYWSICKRMGKMIKECGITKKISFHCSRHIISSYSLKTRNLQRLSA